MTPAQILAMLDAGHVTRFHTRRVLRPQSVAAHSANVALLAMAFFGGVERTRAEALAYALTHDLEERWTGDVPAPVKWASAELDATLEGLGAKWLYQHTGLARPVLSPEEHFVLKLADAVDGAVYCYFELQQGSRVLLPTLERYLSHFRRLGLKSGHPLPAAALGIINFLQERYDDATINE